MLSKIHNNVCPPSPQSTPASIALLILRLIAGIAFIYHGYGKIQTPFSWMPEGSPVPGFFQFLAAVSEFGGGIAWILGLVTPLASLGMTFTMLAATLFHAALLKHPFVSLDHGPSYELAAAYLGVALVLLFVGPGKFSLDFLLFKKK